MRKKFIGRFLTFSFNGRKDKLSGIVLDYNIDRTLIRRCYDYMLDGYTIFRNEKFENHYGDYEKRAEKILGLKKYSVDKEPRIPIDTLETLFSYLDKKYKLIQLDTRKGDTCDVVRYRKSSDGLYFFDGLTVNAKWKHKIRLTEKACSYISFDNDYLNSLKLIAKL